MEQEMRVSKHTTIKGEDNMETYKVLLKFASTKGSQVTIIRKAIIDSDYPTVFTDFPLNELVSLKISKPQKKLA